MSEDKTMHLSEIVNGLKDGSITILENNHNSNPILDQLENKLEIQDEQIQKYKDQINKGQDEDGKSQRMIDYYGFQQNTIIGHYINDVEVYCFSCDARSYLVLLDEKTLGLIPSTEYWKIADASGKKYGYKANKEDCKCCPTSDLVKAGKLVSEIEVPSGELIFQNFFKTDELYDYVGEDKYQRTSINSLLGRNELMQHLGTNNVGYGQMGNMSVNIYSNGIDIIIGDYLDRYEDNKWYYDENPDKLNDEIKEDISKGEAFKKELEAGGYEDLGNISLDVWRWMCMDAKLLAEHNEEPDEDAVKVNVPKGTYVIEHYYDISYDEYIYSRIKIRS